MPVERNNGQATVITGNAILGYRAKVLIQALEFHIKTGGKMRLTRSATPGTLRQIATEFTGKPYARSAKALQQALDDMRTLVEGKDLDQIGEVAVVNKAVGGVAADLQEDK